MWSIVQVDGFDPFPEFV
jgi:hypothetical protein